MWGKKNATTKAKATFYISLQDNPREEDLRKFSFLR